MFKFPKSSKDQIQIFLVLSVLVLTILVGVSENHINKLTLSAPYLFYGITIILLIFYTLISITIILKYLSDKRCLFFVPIACAFIGSVALIIEALNRYPDSFLCGMTSSVKYNDFLTYYFYRNTLTILQLISAAFLYRYHSHSCLAAHNHIIVIFISISLTFLTIMLAMFSPDQSMTPGVTTANISTSGMLPQWQLAASKLMLMAWGIALLLIMHLTRFRSLFWTGIYFYCIFYILTLAQLLFTKYTTDTTWYQARLFETLGTLVFIIIIFLNAFSLYRKSNTKYKNAYQNSIRDFLTQLFNRRYFYDVLAMLVSRASEKNPLTVIVCDIDHFKRINDKYGHHQGDRVIQYVAWMLQDLLRKSDIVARIGGEEFALILPGTEQQHAITVAERIRQAIGDNNVNNRVQLPEPVTISMGVYTTESACIKEDECVKRADEALYQAKAAGRNRIVIWKASATQA